MRHPKPTDTPAVGDVVTVEGMKFRLYSIVSAGTRDPNGFRVYRFRNVRDPHHEIDIPSSALPRR